MRAVKVACVDVIDAQRDSKRSVRVQVFRPKEISAPQLVRRAEAWAAGRQGARLAGQNVERTRREARLDADDDVDGARRQTRLRQSGAQLLFRDHTERKRPARDFGDETARSAPDRRSGPVAL